MVIEREIKKPKSVNPAVLRPTESPGVDGSFWRYNSGTNNWYWVGPKQSIAQSTELPRGNGKSPSS